MLELLSFLCTECKNVLENSPVVVPVEGEVLRPNRHHGFELSRIKIEITSVTSLMANQDIASDLVMCVNVHVIGVKVQL